MIPYRVCRACYIIPALIGAGAALAGGVAGTLFSMRNTDKTNQANKDIAADTNAYNERMQREQWSREDNAYQRKVADLRSAGLNPALALGGGSDSSLSFAAQSPTMQTPPPSDFGLSAAGSQVLSAMALNNTVRATDADIANKSADTMLKGIMAQQADENYKQSQFDNMLTREFKRQQILSELESQGMSRKEAQARVDKSVIDTKLANQSFAGYAGSGTWSGIPSSSTSLSTPLFSYSETGPVGKRPITQSVDDSASALRGVVEQGAKTARAKLSELTGAPMPDVVAGKTDTGKTYQGHKIFVDDKGKEYLLYERKGKKTFRPYSSVKGNYKVDRSLPPKG